MPIFDTHCHLNHEQFVNDWEDVLNRAKDADVRRLLLVGYDLESSRRAVYLSSENSVCRAAIGIHPEAAEEWTHETRKHLLDLYALNPNLISAWGEIGLDNHWKTVDPAVQRFAFGEQLDIAIELDLPVTVHCREAYDETIDEISHHPGVKGVLHCFTGSVEQAKRALALNLYIGVGGVLTYKNSHSVRETIAEVPLERLLLETDAPYLAPQPWRGKRNEPAYLTAVVTQLSSLLETSVDEISRQTWENSCRLFG